MIDWLNVFTNAIWLVGLAICIATISYADWQAWAAGARLRSLLETPLYALALYSGLLLVGLGAALSTERWWERLAWALITLGFAYSAWRARAMLHSE